ncbi:MAG: hypothetical protein RJA52_1405 [Bacteroidota bacterium]
MKKRGRFWRNVLNHRFLIIFILVVLYGFGRKNWFLSWSGSEFTNAENIDYFEKYQSIAIRQMKTHGIPASIILAQGYLESNGGQSELALMTNNHFGLKCYSKTCEKGHCTNFEDDSHKDFFLIFENPESSYEEHSQFLKKERYQPLFSIQKGDYKSWAKGLKKAGYATDPGYDIKLIRLIENYKLNKYDSF